MERMTNSVRGWLTSMLAVGLFALAASCRHDPAKFEGPDPSTMPDEVRSDYVLFTLRCSKCHSLARPLQSGITDDVFWTEYVERMRLQPASGISPDDATHILRFLHYFSSGKVMRADEQHPQQLPWNRDGGT